MLSIFTKPLEAVGQEDIDLLLWQNYPEGSQVEYKEALPHKHGKADPWYQGSNQIEDYARNQLLAEIVAFANSYGGHLLIGIEESETRPPVASGIRPLPRCADLAEKLRLQARDCIEPQLPAIHAKGIGMASDGSGVVIVRVPRSISAPHRLTTNLACFCRRADRTEKLTMREIQDLTLARAREAQATQQRFVERHAAFIEMIQAMKSSVPVNAIRATAVPLDADLHVGRLYRHPRATPFYGPQKARIGQREVRLELPDLIAEPRPVIRGVRYKDDSGKMKLYQDLFENGVVDFWLLEMMSDPEWDAFYIDMIMGLSVNALLTANRLRIEAGSPEAEYGFELELRRFPIEEARLSPYESGHRLQVMGRIPGAVTYPRLSLGSRSELSALLTILNRDIWNSAGKEPSENLEVLIPDNLLT